MDEPTVGVDPIIRNAIWDHLVEITNTRNKTVIITTHYIEETRQAHVVCMPTILVVGSLRLLITELSIFVQIGLMRGGKFLAEESPDDLKSKYQCDTLEEVFLKLAILQNMGKRRRSSIAQEICEQVSVPAALTVRVPH